MVQSAPAMSIGSLAPGFAWPQPSLGALTTVATDAGKGVNLQFVPVSFWLQRPTNGSMTRKPPPRKRLQPGPGLHGRICNTYKRFLAGVRSDSASMRQIDYLYHIVSSRTNPIRQLTRHSVMPTCGNNLQQRTRHYLIALPRSPSLQHPGRRRAFDYVQARVRACAASVRGVRPSAGFRTCFVSKVLVRCPGCRRSFSYCDFVLQIPCGSCTAP